MAGSARDDYDDYADLAPVLQEFAALDADAPRRAVLRDRLVAAYLPLARHIARRFVRRGEPLDDLEQVASMGLLHALDRFDPGQERNFLSYAIPTITGEVRRYFRDKTWSIRTPRIVKERYVAVGAATTALSRRLDRAPTVGELAEHLQITREDVAEALAAQGSRVPDSLDAPAGAGRTTDGAALVDTLVSHDADLDRAEDRATLHDLVAQLPERERRILVLRFLYDRTQAEIGAELCISQMHVSRLLARTLDLMRERALEAGRGEVPRGPVHAA